MELFTVSFFGHRRIIDFDRVSSAVEDIIEKVLEENENVEFLVGRNGDFDSIVSSAIVRCKNKYGNKYNSYFVLVMPYETATIKDNQDSFLKYYDEIDICQLSSNVHYKKLIKFVMKKWWNGLT